MTWELSFRKKLYKYLGMKADMQEYARAVESMIQVSQNAKKDKRML